ncbi:MAG: hypothetical protein KF830_17015 [Planctomycetes bacterium]|nr:hypothetical protein [Planctomycetota bacterium]
MGKLVWAATIVWLSGPLLLAPAEGAVLPGNKPFSHLEHVPSVWLDPGVPETWRDCRGCHRYDGDRQVSAPQAECDSCHVGTGLLQRAFAAGWERDLSRQGTRTRQAFRHGTHGMLECRECHLPRDNDFQVENYEVRTGPGHCVRCHEAGRVDAAVVARLRWFRGAVDLATAAELGLAPFTPPEAAQRAAYADRLVAVFAGPTGGLNTVPLPTGGEFDHGDHLGLACADCHQGIPAADARQVGTGSIPTQACGTCHTGDAAGTPLPPATAPRRVERPLVALGTFAHADHFGWQQRGRRPGISTAAGYARIEAGCTECHRYAPAVGGRDFPFSPDGGPHTYLACVGCHDGPAWTTGESRAAPRHASTGGSGSGWRDCARCHEFGQDDLTSRRPHVEVERHRERTFDFPAHTHPDITQRGIIRAGEAGRPERTECRDCHRARVPELPSRRRQQAFRHDVHLPATPKADDCLVCHPRAAAAADAAALGGDDFRTYDLGACTQCHWGGPVTETTVPEPAPPRARVVAFPHGPHVTKAQLACGECHAPSASGQDMTTKPGALQCGQCHDHRDGGPTTEGLFGEAVGSCARCHHDEKPAPGQRAVAKVPPAGEGHGGAASPRYRVEQAAFAGFAAPQHHPLGTACTECHRAHRSADGSTLTAQLLPAADHLFAGKAASVHGGGPKEPADCLRCHWKPVGSWRAAVDSAQGKEEDKRFRRLPESAATRQQFGNRNTGYPGGERAKG